MNNSNSNSKIEFKIDKKFAIKLIIILLLLVIFICILIKVSSDMSYDSIHDNSSHIVLLRKDRDADKIGDRLNNQITEVFKHHTNSNFSISSWIYIEDWNFGNNKYKIILEERDNEDNLNMLIALDKNNNNLIFGIRINKYISDESNENSNQSEMTYYVYENIKTQKWVNIVYVVKNTMVELFIDGVLTQRNEISNNIDTISDRVKNVTYKLTNSDDKKVYLLPYNRDSLEGNTGDFKSRYGFKGKISKLYYFNTDITSAKAKEIYEAGPY